MSHESRINRDPLPWVTEDGKRQAMSEVPYQFGRKTYADYKPRPEYDEAEPATLPLDPTPWVSWGVRYGTQRSKFMYFKPRPAYDQDRSHYA